MSQFPKIVECSFKTGVVWITVTFVSVVWTLILTAPIHSRGSICDQLMLYWIFPNVFTWRNKLIYILDGLTFSANFRFGDNYSFNKIQQFSIENITWKVSFWYFTDVEKECWDGNQIHDHDSRKKHLQTDEVININSTTTLAGRSDILLFPSSQCLNANISPVRFQCQILRWSRPSGRLGWCRIRPLSRTWQSAVSSTAVWGRADESEPQTQPGWEPAPSAGTPASKTETNIME